MSFIPEDERATSEEMSVVDAKAQEKIEKPKEEDESKGGLFKSIGLLLVIFVGLFLAKPYFTGEQEILDVSGLPEFSFGGSEESVEDEKVVAELIIPKVRDRELKALVEEFKAGYEKLYNDPEHYALVEPTVKIARFSKDRKNFVIDMEMYDLKLQLAKDGGVEEYVRGELETLDIIFKEDQFQRLITDKFDGKIRLYPELKK